MKYVYQFACSFDDTSSPKRHALPVEVKARLEFEFDDVGKPDNRDFHARTGSQQGAFETSFKARAEQVIMAHYKEATKESGKALNSQQDWENYLKRFTASQQVSVADMFKEILGALSKKANTVEAEMMPVKKKVTSTEALALYLEHHPVKFTVADKFFGDHVVKSIDSNTVKESAASRYIKNNTGTSSWIELDVGSLKSKAGAGQKIAKIHSGQQQIGVYITCKQWTARVTESKFNPKKDKKPDKNTVQIIKGRETLYIDIEITKNESFKIFVLGGWDPNTGEAEIYHYEANPPGSSILQDKYLTWWFNPRTKKFTAPA